MGTSISPTTTGLPSLAGSSLSTNTSGSTPLSSIQGLASGIQWQTMIDQLVAADQTRMLTPLTTEQTNDQNAITAWGNYKTALSTFSAAAAALQTGTTFDNFQVSGGTDSSGRTLLSATASSAASAGDYQVQVMTLAQAEKLGGSNVADVNAAMGLSGTFLVGGKSVTVAASDSLAAIRDKINAVDTGTSPSNVSASILTVSSGVNRLVLSSDVGGSAGIELTENDGSSVLSGLGVVDSTLQANTLNGNARSYGFSSSSQSLAKTLGITMPAAGTIEVNGTAVSIDLSQDSLASIAAKINTAVGSGTASVDTEVVNGANVSRLIVNGTVTADTGDGAPAQALSTQNLQQLGFLEPGRSSSQLVPPSDATLKIDGVTITRSTNTISDAIAGVTLNLQQAEPGTTVDLSITADTSKTVQAIQSYASAYNALVNFVNTNTASGAPLAFNASLRSSMAALTNVVFSTVTGLQNSTYTNQALAGVALDANGQMQVDTTALNAALTANPAAVKALFTTNGSTTSSALKYMAGGTNTQPGTYAVSITQAATTPTATGTTLAGTYGNTSVADGMQVVDSFTGRTASISLADSDTAATIAQKLNAAFGTAGVSLNASVTSGGALQIAGTHYGSSSSIQVGFTLAGAAAAEQLGFSSTAYAGTDVQGTINGYAATGGGQLLTANAPNPGDTNAAQGLQLLYTGTTPATASATYVLGVGGMMYNAANPLVTSGGIIDQQTAALQDRITELTQQQADVQNRLTTERKTLTAQFTAMETAMSTLQAQGQALTNQLNSLQAQTA